MRAARLAPAQDQGRVADLLFKLFECVFQNQLASDVDVDDPEVAAVVLLEHDDAQDVFAAAQVLLEILLFGWLAYCDCAASHLAVRLLALDAILTVGELVAFEQGHEPLCRVHWIPFLKVGRGSCPSPQIY